MPLWCAEVQMLSRKYKAYPFSWIICLFCPFFFPFIESMVLVNSKDDFQDRAEDHFSTSQPMKINVNNYTIANICVLVLTLSKPFSQNLTFVISNFVR
jgi:hypothetical protein